MHRQSGAAEVLVSSGKRWALMHELRGAAEPRLPELLAKTVAGRSGRGRGFQVRAASQDRGASRWPTASRCCFPTIPRIVGIATDAAVETTLPVVHLDDIPAIAAMMRKSAIPVEDVLARSVGRKLRSRMAQLSDDCFAFGGPMMSVDEAVAHHRRAGDARCARSRPLRSPQADGRILARDIPAPLPLPPFTNSAVDGYAVRGGDLPQGEEQAFPIDRARSGRRVGRRARSSRATRCGSSPARRCPTAPTPCSCRRTCASMKRAGWCCRRA